MWKLLFVKHRKENDMNYTTVEQEELIRGLKED